MATPPTPTTNAPSAPPPMAGDTIYVSSTPRISLVTGAEARTLLERFERESDLNSHHSMQSLLYTLSWLKITLPAESANIIIHPAAAYSPLIHTTSQAAARRHIRARQEALLNRS